MFYVLIPFNWCNTIEPLAQKYTSILHSLQHRATSHRNGSKLSSCNSQVRIIGCNRTTQTRSYNFHNRREKSRCLLSTKHNSLFLNKIYRTTINSSSQTRNKATQWFSSRRRIIYRNNRARQPSQHLDLVNSSNICHSNSQNNTYNLHNKSNSYLSILLITILNLKAQVCQ